MFELSVACKYLVPRWRQLSVSIITLVSTFVIALVVWLIVVFFSVKDGLENSWIEKIIALTAPIRLTPTEDYYQSYYYLVDGISSASDYTLKTIHEKLAASSTDPYDPEFDEELPKEWSAADRTSDGTLKDFVKEAYQTISRLPHIKGLKISDFETTVANLHLKLLRQPSIDRASSQQFIDHPIYIGSFDAESQTLAQSLLPLSNADFNHLLFMQASSDVEPATSSGVNRESVISPVSEQIKQFFDHVDVTTLKTPVAGWSIPKTILPIQAQLTAAAVVKNTEIVKVVIPRKASDIASLVALLQTQGLSVTPIGLFLDHGKISFKMNGKQAEPLPLSIPLVLEAEVTLQAKINKDSLIHLSQLSDVKFLVSVHIQGVLFSGESRMGPLMIDHAETHLSETLLYAISGTSAGLQMPKESPHGEPVILPKNFKDAGSLIGDKGYLSYFSPTPSSVQEQRTPIYVAGFYDPGIMPIGGKYVLASKELTSLIRSSYGANDTLMGNGLNVRFDHIQEAADIKKQLVHALQERGIADYWKVETYEEFDFTKDLLQQLRSEKHLFGLISLIIIIVACSNIISMLIILVNDKKSEIGILRSMGAHSRSIALIFGLCGMVMGALGSLIGIIAALITLTYINELVGWISRLQGYDLFNPVFYGNSLPSELSLEALSQVMLTTVIISLLAGIVPAVKASLIRPSMILRAE